MMLNKNIRAIVCLPFDDRNFLSIVARVLQGDTLVPYLFIIDLDDLLPMSTDLIKENGFKLRSR